MRTLIIDKGKRLQRWTDIYITDFSYKNKGVKLAIHKNM